LEDSKYKPAVFALEEIRMSRPVQHDVNRPKAFWKVLDEIHQALKQNKIIFQQEDIYVGKVSSDSAVDNEKQLKKSQILREYTFDDLYTRIIIVDELNEMEGTILLAYNPAGIQLAFGLGYNERKAVAVIGEEDTFMSTTACADIKVMPYFAMIHKVKEWFPMSNHNVLKQLERSKTVMNKPMEVDNMLKFVDLFLQYNIKYNDCLENHQLLNIPSFERFVFMLKGRIISEFSRSRSYSSWDLFNIGNVILKPDSEFELKELIPMNYFWGSYVFSRLG
jgi:hypothetical protein